MSLFSPKITINNKGIALGTVLLFITFFSIIATAVMWSSRQEQPLVEKIDMLTRARYAATGFIDMIELKMKTLDSEFMEAIRDDERLRVATDPQDVSKSTLFNEFFADFRNPESIKLELDLQLDPFSVFLKSVTREHLQSDDKSTSTSTEIYYIEIIRVTVVISWKDDSGTGTEVTEEVTRTFRFKRRYKS
jgi:hypothetical protein